MLNFDFVTNSKDNTMKGGKRENAGRKSTWNSKTKVYRLPIELEPQIMKLAEQYKSFDSVTKSIDRVKPNIVKPTVEQTKRLQIWLYLHKFAKSKADARKMTATNCLIKETVLKYSEYAKNVSLKESKWDDKYNWIIQDLINLFS